MKYVNKLSLIFLFSTLIIITILPFIASAEFDLAQKLEANYRWKKAGETYREAIKLSRFNTKYLARYADFLVKQSTYRKDKISWLEQAEKLYKRALQLNPRCAEYAIKLGEVQIAHSSWLIAHGAKESEIKMLVDKAMGNFKKAVENDPNGFNTVYSAGYAAMPVWGFLEKNEKEIVLNNLKYSLKKHPWYGARYIYPRLWKYTRDFSLLQCITPSNLEANKILYFSVLKNSIGNFYKRQKNIVDFYKQKKEPEKFMKIKEEKKRLFEELRLSAKKGKKVGWVGISDDEKDKYGRGRMYCTGTMYTLISFPEGKKLLKIKAKGSQAKGFYPYMIVDIDGKEVGSIFVNNTEWRWYTFEVNTDGGLRVLAITFANDYCFKHNGKIVEDRNLYIGETKVE